MLSLLSDSINKATKVCYCLTIPLQSWGEKKTPENLLKETIS